MTVRQVSLVASPRRSWPTPNSPLIDTVEGLDKHNKFFIQNRSTYATKKLLVGTRQERVSMGPPPRSRTRPETPLLVSRSFTPFLSGGKTGKDVRQENPKLCVAIRCPRVSPVGRSRQVRRGHKGCVTVALSYSSQRTLSGSVWTTRF